MITKVSNWARKLQNFHTRRQAVNKCRDNQRYRGVHWGLFGLRRRQRAAGPRTSDQRTGMVSRLAVCEAQSSIGDVIEVDVDGRIEFADRDFARGGNTAFRAYRAVIIDDVDCPIGSRTRLRILRRTISRNGETGRRNSN